MSECVCVCVGGGGLSLADLRPHLSTPLSCAKTNQLKPLLIAARPTQTPMMALRSLHVLFLRSLPLGRPLAGLVDASRRGVLNETSKCAAERLAAEQHARLCPARSPPTPGARTASSAPSPKCSFFAQSCLPTHSTHPTLCSSQMMSPPLRHPTALRVGAAAAPTAAARAEVAVVAAPMAGPRPPMTITEDQAIPTAVAEAGGTRSGAARPLPPTCTPLTKIRGTVRLRRSTAEEAVIPSGEGQVRPHPSIMAAGTGAGKEAAVVAGGRAVKVPVPAGRWYGIREPAAAAVAVAVGAEGRIGGSQPITVGLRRLSSWPQSVRGLMASTAATHDRHSLQSNQKCVHFSHQAAAVTLAVMSLLLLPYLSCARFRRGQTCETG